MQLVHNSTGLVHVISAIAALLLGLGIFCARKGTRFHKQLGYGYVISMVIMNVTAFLIYRLYRGFGPFHIAAVISSATLVAGFIPVFLRRPAERWLPLHFEFMAWSYVGLLAAAAAEIGVRLPKAPFWGGVLGCSIAVFILGAIVISRARSRLIK